jgi:glycerol-3-phosphate acyltransferase PlsX
MAMLSAGNSGAVMAAALKVLGRSKGVDRPAIATTIPTPSGIAALIDAGANVECKPHHLLQFALMGTEYARRVLGYPNPRVGLLSNGTEASKGTSLTREADRLLSESQLDYHGYIEGREMCERTVDVIVCDGFTGNIVLKTIEGAAKAIGQMLREEIYNHLEARLGALLMARAIQAMKDRMNWEQYGGAPLLGFRGTGIIAHGGSTPLAIKNAIYVAERLAVSEIRTAIEASIAQHADLCKRERDRADAG